MLSVIVPVYNVEKYLRQCLNSIVNQTYKDLQIILVNDGSSDKSLSIMREFADIDDRIIIIDKPNGGLVSAYVAGYEKAKGEYVTFVDSDDWIDNVMYENLINKFDSDVDMVLCGYEKFYCDNVEKSNYFMLEGIHSDKSVFYGSNENKKEIHPARWDKIYKREIIDTYIDKLDISISFAEDVLFTSLYVNRMKKYCIVNRHYYHYRASENSMTYIFNPDYIDHVSRVYYNLINEEKNNKSINNLIFNVYSYLLNLIMKIESKTEKKCYFKRVITEETYKLSVSNKIWHCNTPKEYFKRFLLKHCGKLHMNLALKRAKIRR